MLLCQPLAKPAKRVLIGQLEIVLNFDHVEPPYTQTSECRECFVGALAAELISPSRYPQGMCRLSMHVLLDCKQRFFPSTGAVDTSGVLVKSG